MTPTEAKLIDILTQGLKLRLDPAIPVTPKTAIFGKVDGLGLDSVDVLEVAVLIDKHFGVVLEDNNDDVRAAMTTIGSLAGYIDSHSAARG